jgi:hypothetical protein
MLLFVLIITYVNGQGSSSTGSTTVPTTTAATTTTTTYYYSNNNYGSNSYGYGDDGYGDDNYNDGYNDGYAVADNYDGNDDNDGYGSGYGGSQSYGGSPSYGGSQSYGGSPSYSGGSSSYGGKGYSNSKYANSRSMLGSLDVWIRSADDWEQKEDRYRGRGKYGKGRDNRKKRSSSRVRFPVRHFRDVKQFPLRRFPPLISILPWLPIFYDKLTYQTIIFSPAGGLYIIPPLINFYGQRFAVAQLIKWGYASLVSSGGPPPPNINVAPLVQPAPPGGVAAGVVGAPPAGPTPVYDSKQARFVGGVQTNYPEFKSPGNSGPRPRYNQQYNVPRNSYGY